MSDCSLAGKTGEDLGKGLGRVINIMDNIKYIMTEETEYKGIKIRILRPIMTEEEAKAQLHKTINDLLTGFKQ